MTREEAIRRMECCRNFLVNNYSDMGEPNVTAFNMAIKALKQKPCGDLISREDVEECKELMTDINGDTVYAVRMSEIRQLSSVKQEPKYCDRNICVSNEYNGIGCDECEVGNPCLYCKHEFEPQESEG